MKNLVFDQPVCHELQTNCSPSQEGVPVQRCCRRRSSACSPFRVLVCSRCRNSRFFWALCSWFSRVEVAIFTLPGNRHGIVMVSYLAPMGILPLQPGSAGMAEFYC